MIPLKDLAAGMRVKIVDSWEPGPYRVNHVHSMDKWLGKTMTVEKVYTRWVEFIEDEEKWAWDSKTLDRIDDGGLDESNIPGDREFYNLIQGGQP